MRIFTACNPTQATLVIKLRPFTSPDDFKGRTRKQKGVGNNMYDTYLSVIDGMSEVDKVLDDCEQIGRDLGIIMKIWATGSESNVKKEAGDVGTNLTDAPDVRLVAAAEASQDPTIRAAFEGYLRKQPEGVPDKIVLKDYQMLGVNWLALLYRRKTSCILADEMGTLLDWIRFENEKTDDWNRIGKDRSSYRTHVASQIDWRERSTFGYCTFFDLGELDARIFCFRSKIDRRKLLRKSS